MTSINAGDDIIKSVKGSDWVCVGPIFFGRWRPTTSLGITKMWDMTLECWWFGRWLALELNLSSQGIAMFCFKHVSFPNLLQASFPGFGPTSNFREIPRVGPDHHAADRRSKRLSLETNLLAVYHWSFRKNEERWMCLKYWKSCWWKNSCWLKP